MIALRRRAFTMVLPGLGPMRSRQAVAALFARDPMGATHHIALGADAGGVEIGRVDAPIVAPPIVPQILPVRPGGAGCRADMAVGPVIGARRARANAAVEDKPAVVREDRADAALSGRQGCVAVARAIVRRRVGCAVAHCGRSRSAEAVGGSQTAEARAIAAAAGQRCVLKDIVGRAACHCAHRAGHALDDLAAGGVANDALDRRGLALDRLRRLVVDRLRCLRDLHGSTADQRTAASACAEFRQSHLYRHAGQSQPVRCPPHSARRYSP